MKFNNFLNIDASRSYDAVPGEFSFVATFDAVDPSDFPIKIGDECRILVDDDPFITGFVFSFGVSHSKNSHEISVNGCSKLADLVDSTMDAEFNFLLSKDSALKDGLQQIVDQANVNATIIDDVFFIMTEDDTLEAQIGSSVWSLMCQAAVKYQCLLGETANGDVFLTRGGGDQINFELIKKIDGTTNNVLSSGIEHNARDRFHRYAIVSQFGQADLITATPPAVGVSKAGESIDESIRNSRFKCVQAEQSMDDSLCTTRAEWQSNYARVNAMTYSCAIQGFRTESGLLIEPGYIVYVDDDYVQLHADMLIKKVSISYSSSSGSTASLTLVSPDAYTLKANQATAEESGNDFKGIFRDDE